MATRMSFYIAYPDGISKVSIIRHGASKKQLTRPVKHPVMVEDEDGDRFIISKDSLFNDPASASFERYRLAKAHGIPIETEEPAPDDEDDEDEDDDDALEEEEEGDDLEDDDDDEDDEEQD